MKKLLLIIGVLFMFAAGNSYADVAGNDSDYPDWHIQS
ncbi:hypothetical protein JOC33_003255 [Thalassobacillus pellis]|nr:hypothetical protein [Thalassobacillus pellis]